MQHFLSFGQDRGTCRGNMGSYDVNFFLLFIICFIQFSGTVSPPKGCTAVLPKGKDLEDIFALENTPWGDA